MSDINVVTLSGRLGKDPELTYTKGGTAICKFSLATGKKWTGNDGQKHESTEWNNISVFGKFAEIVNRFVAKGKRVIVVGELSTNSWVDNQTGQTRIRKEIKARDISFLDFKDTEVNEQHERQNGHEQEYQDPWHDDAQQPAILDGDDLPF